jgi:co-chaperonin GroES (HSP10)
MARSNAIGKMRQIAENRLNSTDPVLAHLRGLTGLDKATKRQLLKNPLDGELEVLHSQVLVMGYIKPAVSKGGIILTDNAVEEDRFQGNVGLVVGLGKGAFKDDNIAKFNGDKPSQIGDWVMYVAVRRVSPVHPSRCRAGLFSDTRILMKVSTPEIYY